jgi:hypothetical protein
MATRPIETLIPAGYVSRAEAMEAGSVSKSTLERAVKDGLLEMTLIPRKGKRPEPYYPLEGVLHLGEQKQQKTPAIRPAASGVPPEFFHELVELMREVVNRQNQLPLPAPEAKPLPWIPLEEAVAISGLSKRFLLRQVRQQKIVGVRAPKWKLLRKSVEGFEGEL